jgi:hypothetical protein
LQAVNRVPFFYKHPLLHRVGIVVVPALLVKIATGYLYKWQSKSRVLDLLNEGNTPFWKNPNKVPELDNVFFELDDDRNFEPNILHHGM